MRPVLHHYYYSSTRGGYSEEYQAVLDRATALGYTHPSAAQKTLQNDLVVALKDAGIWDLLDVFYVFATDGDSDFATLNWKTPASFQCSKANSPTFTANQGFAGNGTTSYLNTNWDASTNGVNYTQNNASYGAWINNNIADGNQIDFGSCNASFQNAAYIMARNAIDSVGARINDASSLSMSGIITSVGLWHVKRTASNARQIFHDGISITSDTAASQARNARDIYIGALNNAGVASNFSTKQVSMFWTGASLNTLEVTLDTIWDTYLTSL